MNIKPKVFVFGSLVILGICLRLLAASFPFNYDIESYHLVAQIMDQGQNVYATTHRYNYGPVWFNIVSGLYQIAKLFPDTIWALRWEVATLLTIVDVGILAVLTSKFGRKVGLLFFLNPISIMITGQHGQFDNLAILIGLLAVLVYGEDFKTNFTKRKWLGLILLGLSIMTKHILFVFPLWIALKQKGLWQKAVVLCLPVVIFLLGFAPYWIEGSQGILNNVFLYKSFDNAPFWNLLVPRIIGGFIPKTLLFIGSLAVMGILVRKYSLMRSLISYLVCMVIFAPAIANQYLAIAVPFLATNFSLAFLPFVLVTTVHLLIDQSGFRLEGLGRLVPDRLVGYNMQVLLLIAGTVWVTWKAQVINHTYHLKDWAVNEWKTQFK